jgi:CRISPR system Cascade subunit CasC
MRQYFLDECADDLGVRSLDVIRYVADRIVLADMSVTKENAMKMAEKIFNDAGIKTKDQKTKALFFLGKKQADRLAAAAVGGETDKKAIKQILCDNPAVDIALFGRMVADDPSLNEDASAQVAHAISTHEVQTEFDYYTAVDELAPEDNAGAGMLGTIEYNSSTLYRYANIAMHDLSKQLGNKEQAVNAAKLFIQAFANSMPTGKSNTFANQTLPQMLMINIRCDRPVNLVTAFENPIKSNIGNAVPSIMRLFDEEIKAEKYVQPPMKTLYVVVDGVVKPEWGEEEPSITELINDFAKTVEELL